MADETLVADTWLHQTLTGDVALMAEVNSVHSSQAPQNAVMPYVVFDWLGGQDVTYVNGIRVWHSGLWVVKAVDEATTYSVLSAAADRIEALLHRQGGNPDGGTVFTATREAPFRSSYSDDAGKSYRELGGRFRIEVQRD